MVNYNFRKILPFYEYRITQETMTINDGFDSQIATYR
jgi:hypothetical protein